MSGKRVQGIRIAGIAAAVPEPVLTLEDDARTFGAEDAARIFKNTGIKTRHTTLNGMCASDLCHPAAERLLSELGWARDSIDALVFVTQGPDYLSPTTACLLQRRLGLSTDCAAFDVMLGCSGYVYGLWIVSSLLSGSGGKRALLLAGDTITRTSSPLDRAVAPLFGDAGTATAIEIDPGAGPMSFVLGTDGTGAPHLMLPAGGLRTPCSPATAQLQKSADGNVRSLEQTYMNGAEVFTFTLKAVPPLLTAVKAAAGWTDAEIDSFVFHQASSFVLKNLMRACGLPKEKFVFGLESYGNTSSASIPLAICDQLRDPLAARSQRLVLAGFGVGWSWGAVALSIGPAKILPVLVVPDRQPEHIP